MENKLFFLHIYLILFPLILFGQSVSSKENNHPIIISIGVIPNSISAMFKGTVKANGEETIVWYEIPSGETFQSINIGKGNSEIALMPYTITGLKPNTTYKFRISASNPGSDTISSDWLKFTTSQAILGPNVYTLVGTSHFDISGNVNISFMGVLVPNGEKSTTMFEYSTNQMDLPDGLEGHGTRVIPQSVQSEKGGSSYFYYTMQTSSIREGVTYFFRAVAVDINGSQYGSVFPIKITPQTYKYDYFPKEIVKSKEGNLLIGIGYFDSNDIDKTVLIFKQKQIITEGLYGWNCSFDIPLTIQEKNIVDIRANGNQQKDSVWYVNENSSNLSKYFSVKDTLNIFLNRLIYNNPVTLTGIEYAGPITFVRKSVTSNDSKDYSSDSLKEVQIKKGLLEKGIYPSQNAIESFYILNPELKNVENLSKIKNIKYPYIPSKRKVNKKYKKALKVYQEQINNKIEGSIDNYFKSNEIYYASNIAVTPEYYINSNNINFTVSTQTITIPLYICAKTTKNPRIEIKGKKIIYSKMGYFYDTNKHKEHNESTSSVLILEPYIYKIYLRDYETNKRISCYKDADLSTKERMEEFQFYKEKGYDAIPFEIFLDEQCK
ncbi:MAG: fibronectin type III domain-containing protein [Bacteroidia bacterium]|nr:fibronectin type III domain-containing protein [Bacteroidia bacterium]